MRAIRSRKRLVTMIVAASLPSFAYADKTYAGLATGSWNTASNWSGGPPGGVPASGENVSIVNTDAISRNVILDINTAALNILTIGNSGSGTNSLTQTSNFNVNAVGEIVGVAPGTLSIANALHTQSAGGNTYASYLVINGGEGTVALQNQIPTASYSLSGTGSITVSGTQMTLLHAPGTNYTTPAFYVGMDGAGSFTQSGGTVTLGSISTGGPLGTVTNSVSLYLGESVPFGPGGKPIFGYGNYNLSGGTLNALYGTEVIGDAGIGTFTQSNGNNTLGSSTFTSNLTIGQTGQGTYNLSNSGVLTVFGTEIIGAGGIGVFSQIGGSNTINATSPLAGGGTTPATLQIAASTGSAGTYTLGSGGTLTVHGSETIGGVGTGQFVQNGGANTMGSSAADLGTLTVSNGGYTMSAGTLAVQGGESIGVLTNPNQTASVGTFNQPGGTHNIGSAAVPTSLVVGGGEDGSYTLSNSATLNVVGNELIGALGNGTFTQTGGTHTLTSNSGPALEIGVGSFGAFTLSNSTGPGLFTVNGSAFIGGSDSRQGTGGALTINGGSMTVTGELGVWGLAGPAGGSGNPAGGGSSIDLLAGTLSVGSLVSMNASTIPFTWSGGTLGIGSNFDTSVISSALTLNAAQSLLVTGTLSVDSGNSLTVSGGSVNAGVLSNAGIVNLFGGTLTAGAVAGANLPTGSTGSAFGAFNWLAGTLSIGSSAEIGAAGFFNSSLDLQASRSLLLAGTLSIDGGYSLTLDGGYFSVGTLNNNGIFQFNSGTLQFTASNFIVGATAPFGSTLQLQSNQTIKVSGGTFGVDSGALLYLTGGNVVAANGLTNNGQIDFTTTLSQISGGTLTNNGLINGTGRVASPLKNTSTGIVRASNTDWLQFSGGSNSNAGQIQLLNGGGVEFTKDLTNTGTISGRGVLTATGGLSNSGTIAASGGFMDVYGNVTNTGKVIVTGGSTTTFYNTVTDSSGGTVRIDTNSAAVFLGNVSVSGVTGSGTAYYDGSAVGGPLVNSGASVVDFGGTLAADYIRQNALTVTGNTAINPSGSSSNYSRLSTLSITGGTVDLANNSLIVDSTPVGTIAGYIKSAYNGGSWNGGGLGSSSAQLNSTSVHPTALGYATASDINVSTFAGQPVSGAQVLVKYTWSGDANLDGVVNLLDLNAIATDFGKSSEQWDQGDFNFDGTVNALDFNAIAMNFGEVLPASAPPAEAGSPAGLTPLGALVPEPASLGMIGAMGGLFTRSCRRTRLSPRRRVR